MNQPTMPYILTREPDKSGREYFVHLAYEVNGAYVAACDHAPKSRYEVIEGAAIEVTCPPCQAALRMATTGSGRQGLVKPNEKPISVCRVCGAPITSRQSYHVLNNGRAHLHCWPPK